METKRTIGLLAGGRNFPVMVARGVKEAGHRLVVANFPGHTNPGVLEYADVSRDMKLGKLGKLMDFLKGEGVEQVIMCGAINKSKFMDFCNFDMRALKLLFKMKNKGDAQLLRTVSEEFAREGMEVIPAHVFQTELLTPEGVLTKRQPTPEEWEDLRFGWTMAKELGRLDVGQSMVVHAGVVAAVEALEGTDEAIRRGTQLGGKDCVVIKVFKPGQQQRVDLPAAGLETIRTMARGKAVCLGIEAGKSLFFDREEAVREADRAGIAIVGLTAELLEQQQ